MGQDMGQNVEKHNLYLSRQVWGELKARAFQENASASEIITYLLSDFLKARPADLNLPRYQPRMVEDGVEQRKGRSVYVPARLWQAVQDMADRQHFSVTGLVESLLKNYLGLLAPDLPTDEGSPTGRYIQIGDKLIDLGENPQRIDLKSGKPLDQGK